MKRPKKSAVESVVKQAKTRKDREKSPAIGLQLSYLLHGEDSSGAPTLRCVFKGVDGKPDDEHDLSYLLALPNLGQPLAEGFLKNGIGRAPLGRASSVGSLKKGLNEYLIERHLTSAQLADFNRAQWLSFIRWLNSPRMGERKPLCTSSRSAYLSICRVLLRALADHQKYGTDAVRSLASIPRNPWPGDQRRRTPYERLSLEHLNQLTATCERLILATKRRLDERDSLISVGRHKEFVPVPVRGTPTHKRSRLTDREIFFFELDQMFPTTIPAAPREDGAFTLRYHAERYHAPWSVICSYFQPDVQELIPFVFWLARQTAFNPQTLFELEQSDVSEVRRFGHDYIRIEGKKRRASVDPVMTLPAGSTGTSLGLREFFQILERFTSRIRKNLPAHASGRVFVYAGSIANTNRATHFQRERWLNRTFDHQALQAFFRINKLAPAQIVQIRATVIDEVQIQTGDVLQAAKVGNHRDPKTTLEHYTSGGTRSRYQDRLGEVLILRERWFDSDGKIDPRVRKLTADMDRGAATPGFICLDPFSSPMARQEKDRLCSAYGECPNCPLSAARPEHAPSVALYEALAHAIYRAQSEMAPQSWLSRWVPVLKALKQLQAHVPRAVALAASRLSVELPTVG